MDNLTILKGNSQAIGLVDSLNLAEVGSKDILNVGKVVRVVWGSLAYERPAGVGGEVV